ncbi:OmpW family protein [Leisingera sp. M523]|uniref:OmpW/AlkL family protein n=1 Tax=Leisingera sp. M523 TaxID=2867013 RepID=UPI0021A27576|nr:OmpW family outer membrane protein [Leisingera sp. M523]UWQ27436.1 outer membrane beta-barrel protein [Leisingera sp. M523]
MKRMVSALALTSALAALTGPALAQQHGDWTVGVGIANVNPKSGNGTLAGMAADIDDGTALSLTVEYFFRDNWGVELLAASPFEHDVTLAGAGYAASAKQLPPTISVNYHFPTQGKIKPFVGLGLNYTTFFEESSPLGVIEMDDSFGVALNAGADWQISDRGAVRFNVRYIDIESDVTLNGAAIGTAEIDPVVLNIAYVHRF